MTYRNLTLSVAMFLLLMTTANRAQAQQYIFRTIDLPGAGYTFAECNNNLGQIVGFYYMAGLPNTNFLLSKGVFEPSPITLERHPPP
jgi:hypothetical protein